MKFLVITRPNGASHDLDSNAAEAKTMANELRNLHNSNVLEASFAFIGGGSAYVINADTSKQLAVLVRSNPLFQSQNHEIIPVADSYDFLDGMAEYLS